MKPAHVHRAKTRQSTEKMTPVSWNGLQGNKAKTRFNREINKESDPSSLAVSAGRHHAKQDSRFQ
jgi:hypothetical protein